MAVIVLTDVSVTIGGVDLSDRIASISLASNADAVETTAFGTAGARTRVGGLKDNSVTFDFHQDYALTEVEATIYPLIGQATNVVIKPTSGAISATNPAYLIDGSLTGGQQAGQVLVTEWTPVNGAVGELATVSVTWPISGAIVKDVTP
jgi:hypothetical protein